MGSQCVPCKELRFEVAGTQYAGLRTTVQDINEHSLPNHSFATIFFIESVDQLCKQWLDGQIQALISLDDVFRLEFLAGVVLSCPYPVEIPPDVFLLLKSFGCEWIRFIPPHAFALEMVTGPHVVYDGSLLQIFRLYEDKGGAFLASIVPTKDPCLFQNMRFTGTHHQTLSIAVPSRFADTNSNPLNGLRIAVKDLFHLAGLKNSLCNRAYYEMCQPAKVTSPIISSLMTAGAHVLGVTKLSSMISKEEPTEAVDYQAPFNPRGDGYQSPAGSSNGSAVAIASYNWLDFSIGTDTSGSGRRPALVNGCFQMRPTHSAITLEGMIPTFLPFDTPCFFGRDLSRFKRFAEIWYASKIERPIQDSDLPLSIIFPLDYFPTKNSDQMSQVNFFVAQLERWTKTKAVRVSIANEWRKSPPPEATEEDVQTFLKDAVVRTYYHDFYHSTDEFRTAYYRRFGKRPYVNSFVKWRWDLGKQVTKAERADAMARIEVYKSWFLRTVLKTEQQRPLLILPIATVEPNYRDVSAAPPEVQTGFDPLYISPILGAPDLVLPIGESSYHSRISDTEEYLPVAVNIVGTPRSDLDLIDTMYRFLTESGFPTEVTTGSTLFGHSLKDDHSLSPLQLDEETV